LIPSKLSLVLTEGKQMTSHRRSALILLAAVVFTIPGAIPARPGSMKSAQPGRVIPAQAVRVIAADFSKLRGPHSTTWKECIGAGRANEGLRADWQEQLTIVQKEIGFRYIRMHGLLNDDMGVYRQRPDGSPVYNWQYIDPLYDYLLSVGLKPFVELAFMPSDLASGTRTIFWWRGNVTPPKSYDRWADLVSNLVRHFQQRYGDAEVKTWYFEVWNEPDIPPFWSADLQEYLKLYTTTAQAVKSVSRDYRVGGPASAIPYRFEEELLKYCAREHVPIDFISTHAYGVKQGNVDETGSRGTVIDGDRSVVRSRMVHSRELIRNSPLPGLQLHFTEWSSSYTPTDYMHDQFHQASFILDKVKGAQESVDSMSYWVFTDIFEENGPRATPFHGGFGLLNYQGIRKPAYFAFQFMNRLGPEELAGSDDSSWVCRNSHGDVQALIWDYTPVVPPAGTNDQVFYKKEQPSKPLGKASLRIDNLPAGTYSLETYQTGYRVNDAYTAYLDLGAPDQLTREQAQMLRQTASGAPAKQLLVKHPGGAFVEDFPLRENDVFLVTLQKL
jgi:xylan 1,4-beta-xylosidase